MGKFNKFGGEDYADCSEQTLCKKTETEKTAATGTLCHHLLVHERNRNHSMAEGKQKTMESFKE